MRARPVPPTARPTKPPPTWISLPGAAGPDAGVYRLWLTVGPEGRLGARLRTPGGHDVHLFSSLPAAMAFLAQRARSERARSDAAEREAEPEVER